MSDSETITFLVPDMTCGHCVATIRGALEKDLPGAAVDVDLATARVTVEGDEAAAENAIRKAGYTPERV